MNQSKVKDERFWLRWMMSGAISRIVDGFHNRVPPNAIIAARRSAEAQLKIATAPPAVY